MFELTNKIEASKYFSHYLFHDDDTNAVAIADHSIADLSDPSSTDDGLLVWDGEVARLISTKTQTSILLDVIMQDGETSTCIISILTACRIEQLTGLQVIPANVEIADYKSCDYTGHQPEYNADNYRGI